MTCRHSALLVLTVPTFAQFPVKKDGQYIQNLDANGCAAQGYDCVALITVPDKLIKGNSVGLQTHPAQADIPVTGPSQKLDPGHYTVRVGKRYKGVVV